jgi:hypothetical protein
MARTFRLMLPLAAAVAVASVLSTASPASAAGVTIGAGETASATGRPADVKHRTPARIRLAASRDHRRDRYVRPIRNDLDCPGAWCRRQFVLMIGIAY